MVLFTDMDGTIVFDGAISEADMAAFRRWREAGHLLVPNTGRSIAALHSALEGFDVTYDYAVLYTGAVIIEGPGQAARTATAPFAGAKVFSASGGSADLVASVAPGEPTFAGDHILAQRTLPADLPAQVMELLEGEDPITIFATTLTRDFQLRDTIHSGTELLTLFTPGTLEDLRGLEVVGIPLHLGRPERGEAILDSARSRWGGILDGARNQDFLDLIPAGVSKGTGITELVALLSGPGGDFEGERLRTIAVGDSWNDSAMHQAADLGVAMAGAPSDVTQHCQCETPSVAALIDDLLNGRA